MSDPLVVAVMLTKDRPAMAARAVAAFRAQTYQNKLMYILDNGSMPPDLGLVVDQAPGSEIPVFRNEERTVLMASVGTMPGRSIGQLRNAAIAFPQEVMDFSVDIICHFDDDDYSHPNRIAEQVALLQASGKEAVGYRDLLFWRDPPDRCPTCRERGGKHTSLCSEVQNQGEAWLYTNNDPRACVGTSLCYWRKTWERQPFKNLPLNSESTGEDTEWLQRVDSLGVSSVRWLEDQAQPTKDPRMIASIHSSNSASYRDIEKSGNWKRVPEFDAYCREKMSL